MSYFSESEKIRIHLFFLFILSIYYLVPYLIIGQLTLDPNDILDNEIVFNSVIGKIFRGDFASVDAFLAGEIEWFYLRRILQPLTFLYAFFNVELAFWITDILVRLTAYLLFFKLARKLNNSFFNSALISCLFASIIITHFGLGIACLPYIIYLLVKNKSLKLKHYFIIGFFGANTDLAYDIFIIPIAFFISLIFYPKNKKYNYKKFYKISGIFFLFIFLSNINLIYAQIFAGPFHRIEWFFETPNFVINLKELILRFLSLPKFENSSYFFYGFPISIYFFTITLISLFSKNKKAYQLLIIIFLILLVNFILKLEFINQIRSNSDGLFKTINWNNIEYSLPVIYGLLFVSLSNNSIIKKAKYIIYPVMFFSIFTLQVRTAVIPIGKNLISFSDLSKSDQNLLRKSFHEQKYKTLFENFVKFSKNENSIVKKNEFNSKYTFKGYYDYKNYKYIKSIVRDKRTLSIDLDPMVAVMNDIRVIDGYHNLYPLAYKMKFRKIIEDQLNYYPEMKKYYDNWGSKVYTFVSNSEVIKINFYEAKKLGAEYVISKYPISSEILKLVCAKCNDSNEIFLYKINNNG